MLLASASGTVPADAVRRVDFALALLDAGDVAAALEAVQAALTAAPGYAEAAFLEGDLMARLDRAEAAVAAFRRYRALDPADRMGATARLARLGAIATPPALPAAYVAALFDDYAPRFDDSLVGALDYRVPELIRDAVDRLLPEGSFAILDLGCGTGLAGVALAPRAARLDGIDLSQAMLREAERRVCYRRLIQGEAVAELGRAEGAPYDLVVAADVLVYLGDLVPVLAGIAAVLRPGGLAVVTIERGEGEAFALGPGLRYRHDPAYLIAAAAEAGLVPVHLDGQPIRLEAGRPVEGVLAAFARPADEAVGELVRTVGLPVVLLRPTTPTAGP